MFFNISRFHNYKNGHILKKMIIEPKSPIELFLKFRYKNPVNRVRATFML